MLTPHWVSVFDRVVAAPILGMRTPALTTFFYLCTLLANTGTVVFVTFAAVIVLALRRRFAEAILVAVVVAGGQALGTLVKSTVARQRPPLETALIEQPGGYSFPSGHAMVAVLLYGVLAFLLFNALSSRRARIAVTAAAISIIVLVGISRVYLGVHWPSDVLAAWVLGAVWLSICAAIYLRWIDRRRDSVSASTRHTGP